MLTINDTCKYFSDGMCIVFNATNPDAVKLLTKADDQADVETHLDDKYANVVFSGTAIILHLTAGPLAPRAFLLSSPVTVGDVYRTMSKFYTTALTDEDHAALRDWKYGSRMWPNAPTEELFDAYGDIQHGTWFEGLVRRRFEQDWWDSQHPPQYPPYVGCEDTCEVYKTYDAKWLA